MNVLVAGGTGFIGTELCRVLANRGHDVTALARNPDDATVPAGVDTTAGDVTDPESIADSVRGRDAIVNLVSLSPLTQPPAGLTHDGVRVDGTRNLLDAATTAGVDRFVQLSGLEADPRGPTAFLRAKGRAEALVRDSALEWVIVRPAVVFGEGGEFLDFTKTLTTPYLTALPAGGRTRFQPIWVGDLAPMLADCVTGDRSAETLTLGGPEPLSLADVTRLYYESTGRSVRIVPIPLPLSNLGLRLAGPVPFVPFGPDQARALSAHYTVPDNDVTEFGVQPSALRTLREYLTADSSAHHADTALESAG